MYMAIICQYVHIITCNNHTYTYIHSIHSLTHYVVRITYTVYVVIFEWKNFKKSAVRDLER